MDTPVSTLAHTSRRAILAGALGGLGAWAASVLGRGNPVEATEGDIVHAGEELTATSVTSLTTSTSTALAGISNSQSGLVGMSNSYIAIQAQSQDFWGLWGRSGSNIGVLGSSSAFTQPGPTNTGVMGVANVGSSSRGVWGKSGPGHAIHGESDTGWAGYFDGKVFTNRFIEFREITNPPRPDGNRARLFVRERDGRTQLCVRFHNGTIRVLATA